ncbi:MAG TPA: glycosyltransferase family 9 protein [Thermoanaerobaculia bacterium]|nr:glycosyltransferase family 9 protein [Thermoanaerobaculia bacterium]
MEILFVRLSSFGDVLFALPAAKALRTSLDAARLTWAIEPPLAPLVEGAAYVDGVLPVDTRGWRRAWRAAKTREEIGKFLGRVRGRGQSRGASRDASPPSRLPESPSKKSPVFDLVVDAQGLFKSALVTGLAPAARKVGFGWKTATERINCFATNERVDVDRAARPHVLDEMLALAEHVTGRTGFERTPDVRHLVERPDPQVDEWLERFGSRPFAVLQPFSSKVNKEWGADDVVAFARWLSHEGIQPVLRWGPGEESRAAELIHLSKKSSLLSSSPSPSNSPLPLLLAPATSPASTARLAARAALFVGADTGPTHLAAAAGTPTLALFGPTPPERFGPVGPRAAVLRESTANYNRSVGRWPVEDVREAARRLLA